MVRTEDVMNRIAVIIVALAILYLARDWLPFPLFRLPGDIEYRSERWHVFFPVTTTLLVSVIVSVVCSFFGHR